MYRVEFEIAVHLFCVTQAQEFAYQKYINDIIKDHRINPILKYSTGGNPDSGLKLFEPTGINWRDAEDGDQEDIQELSSTHSLGTIKAIWFEHRS